MAEAFKANVKYIWEKIVKCGITSAGLIKIVDSSVPKQLKELYVGNKNGTKVIIILVALA